MTRSTRYFVLLILPAIAGCQAAQWPGVGRLLARRETPPAEALAKSPLSTPPAGPVTLDQKVDVLLATARSLETSKKSSEAVKAYEQVLRLSPDHAVACHRLAVLHDQNGRSDLAEKFYQQALARDPRNAQLHGDYGYSCYVRQNWVAAEQHLRRSLELQPTSRRAQNNLGMLLARTNRAPEGMQAFAQAGLSEAEAYNNVAFALALNRRLSEAADQYSQAVALDPKLEPARRSSRELQEIIARQEPQGRILPTSFQASPEEVRAAVVRFPAEVEP